MSENTKSLRTPLGKARGLGSAHSGFEHWYTERFSALIFIPTGFYVLFGILNNVVAGGYSGAMYWLQSPLAATMTLLFLLSGLRHLVCHTEIVMGDYIGRESARLPQVFILKFGAAAMAVLGTLSLAKIFFGV